MACAHPFLINNPGYIPSAPLSNWNRRFIEVPCGWCLNCRVDKRNYLEFECFQEFKKFKFSGAFVTLTYDNTSLLHCLRLDKNNNLTASLVHKDVQDFLKRFRRNLNYFLKKHPEHKDSAYCSPDFKVLYVGEYGENGSVFDRPHWHLLFFGIDYSFCEKMLSDAWRNTWNNSLCDIKPILSGGIRYVLKYCDKQIFGKQAEERYDDNNLERPKMRRSCFFAFDYYIQNKKYILANNCCVDWTKGSKLPVRSYIKNKILGVFAPDYNVLRKQFLDRYELGKGGRFVSLKELNIFRHNLALQREQKLIHQSRSKLKPVFNSPDDYIYFYDDDSEYEDFSNPFIEELVHDSIQASKMNRLDWFELQYYRLHKNDPGLDVIPF